MPQPKKDDAIVVTRVERGVISAFLIGSTPLILNRMSEKAKRELLMPKGRKTAADKATTLKHDPIAEFRASPYTFSDPGADTLLAMPASAPKRALANAALDMSGARKAQIGRLTWCPGEYLPIYGIPKLLISTVRSADINHTPDQRIRTIVPRWAIPLSIHFVRPMLNPTVIINLLVAAGMYIGIGDWRNEKGAGDYGQFEILSAEQAANDKTVEALLKEGRQAQVAAMQAAEPYDSETRELLTWFEHESKVRGKSVAA